MRLQWGRLQRTQAPRETPSRDPRRSAGGNARKRERSAARASITGAMKQSKRAGHVAFSVTGPDGWFDLPVSLIGEARKVGMCPCPGRVQSDDEGYLCRRRQRRSLCAAQARRPAGIADSALLRRAGGGHAGPSLLRRVCVGCSSTIGCQLPGGTRRVRSVAIRNLPTCRFVRWLLGDGVRPRPDFAALSLCVQMSACSGATRSHYGALPATLWVCAGVRLGLRIAIIETGNRSQRAGEFEKRRRLYVDNASSGDDGCHRLVNAISGPPVPVVVCPGAARPSRSLASIHR